MTSRTPDLLEALKALIDRLRVEDGKMQLDPAPESTAADLRAMRDRGIAFVAKYEEENRALFYTQRQWDRVVGWGNVPESRKILKKT